MQQTLHKTEGSTGALTLPFVQRQGGYENEFVQAMRQFGLDYKEQLIADGKIHRFPTKHKDRKDGWYVCYGLAGAFGDWSWDVHEKWNLTNNQVSGINKETFYEQSDKASKAIEEERKHKQEEASRTSLEKWNAASQVGSSPYLIRKNVDPLGVRFHKECVIVPLQDINGKLWSLQSIQADGTKRFLPGGRKKGCFHYLGVLESGRTTLICEGYATGASIHMATQQTVVVAFDAGNLAPVVEELKKAYPKSPLIVAGDDDRWKEQNVGRITAEESAQKHSCSVVFPQFKNTETKPTDFNDLHVLEGITAVKEQLTSAIQFVAWPEPTPLHAIKAELRPVVALPPSLIPEPYRDWLVDIAERMQCPLDYVAVGAIIVTASLIGAGCGIRPKTKDS